VETVSGGTGHKFESGFNYYVSRTPDRRTRMEAVLFPLSVFPVGNVIADAGVVCAVTICPIIGASRSYDTISLST